MTHDVLIDMTSLDTGSRHTGTGRYVTELGAALAALTARERNGLSLGALIALEGNHAIGPLDWKGSAEPPYGPGEETTYLMERRTRLPLTLRRLRPRLVHMPYHMGTPHGSGVPRVVTCLDLVRLILHDDYLPGRPIYRRMLIAAEASRFHTARRVQCISRYTADDLMRLLHVPASRIDIVLLGVDLARYRVYEGDEARAAAAVRERLGLDRPYVFYAGRADPRKNVDVLIRAFAAAAVDDLDLVIVGPMRASDDAVIERALAEAGRPRGVRVLGLLPEDDLPAVMGGALAFVFCSTYEGFGNVPVEAMACGCPVITTGMTSIRETVGDAALIVPPRDVAATADAIRRVVREDSLRADLRSAGLARAALFTWHNTALASVDSYARALA